jgi:hypothetical protein
VTLVISLSPTEDEIHEDARLRDRIATEFSADKQASQRPQPASRPFPASPPVAASPPVPAPPPVPASAPLPTRHPSADALSGRGRIPRGPGRWGREG